MSLWDSFKGLFTSEPSSAVGGLSPYTGIGGASVPSQTILSSNPSEVSLYTGIGGVQDTGFLGSLWDGLKTATSTISGTVKDVWGEAKEVAPVAVQLYKEVKSLGAQSLSLVIPEGKPPSPSYQLSTPYQRDSSGATPSVITTGGGLPLPLILGGIALVVFVFMKGKRK